jgi:hypothetical protein
MANAHDSEILRLSYRRTSYGKALRKNPASLTALLYFMGLEATVPSS